MMHRIGLTLGHSLRGGLWDFEVRGTVGSNLNLWIAAVSSWYTVKPTPLVSTSRLCSLALLWGICRLLSWLRPLRDSIGNIRLVRYRASWTQKPKAATLILLIGIISREFRNLAIDRASAVCCVLRYAARDRSQRRRRRRRGRRVLDQIISWGLSLGIIVDTKALTSSRGSRPAVNDANFAA